MRTIVMMLCRFAVWHLLRERERDLDHSLDPKTCLCQCCQWGRGIEAEADAAFGPQEWRP